jgi:hypothetical protein
VVAWLDQATVKHIRRGKIAIVKLESGNACCRRGVAWLSTSLPRPGGTSYPDRRETSHPTGLGRLVPRAINACYFDWIRRLRTTEKRHSFRSAMFIDL